MQGFWLAFTQVNGIGAVRLRQLRAQFRTIEEAWYADAAALQAAGVPPASIDHQLYLRRHLNPQALLEAVQRVGAWVMTLDDEAYPPLLREIDDAPPVLYGRGTLLPEDQRAIAIVGTRRASGYGKEMARQLARGLVEQDVTIVSGLAYGIDIVAHQAALEAKGRTIAVLGSGIDVLYPAEHRPIAEQIEKSGAVITEFPLGTKPEKSNFPIRNRIISGLTLGTVIVEAPEHSGALRTAELAAEQGRDVFAVPGNASSPNSQGTNKLIQDGATLVLNAEDILRELNLAQRKVETRQTVTKLVPDNPTEALICQQLRREPLHVDELSRACQLSIHEINATLTLMELKGMVYQIAPMTYHLTAEVSTDNRRQG